MVGEREREGEKALMFNFILIAGCRINPLFAREHIRSIMRLVGEVEFCFIHSWGAGSNTTTKRSHVIVHLLRCIVCLCANKTYLQILSLYNSNGSRRK